MAPKRGTPPPLCPPCQLDPKARAHQARRFRRKFASITCLSHVHSPLQRFFQVVALMALDFLRPRVLVAPLVCVVRDGHVLGRLSGATGGLGLGLLADMLAEAEDLIEDHFAHLLHVFDDFEVEVESRRAGGLVGGVVPDVQIAMLEGFLDGDARGRVECQHSVKEVERVRVGLREEPLEGHLGHEGEVAHVFLRTRGPDAR